MARKVKEQEYAEKRNEILAEAQRLVYTKGYERMTIQDILAQLQISSGAFYHYFDSKQALLEALVDRMGKAAEQTILPILQDPDLSAIEKFRRYFEASFSWKQTQRELILSLLPMWYSDENAFIRQKMTSESMKITPRLLEPIIRQGVEEKVFTARFPEQAAEIIVGIQLSLSDILIGLLLSTEPGQAARQRFETTLEAIFDAMERILGAPAGALKVFEGDTFKDWFVEFRPEPESK
jgi:TetR/AcrR family transcriptional regulator, transcriptional repressor for nem operon